MANAQAATRVNSVLLLIIGLLIGVIGGYLYGRSNNTGGTAAVSGATSFLNDRLAQENQWIVEGMNCPMANCTNTLLECSGDLPRQIRDWVNKQVAAGRAGQDIRNEIIRTHGDQLFKTFSRAGQDST